MNTYEFYRGYVKSDGKAPVEPFKREKVSDSELRTFNMCKNLDSFCGVLAENSVLIDIDNEAQSVVLKKIVDDYRLKCRVLKTTRGMHFLFLNDGRISQNFNNVTLACGLKADIKVGVSNAVENLRKKGVDRNIIYDIYQDEEEYETVPNFLLPVVGSHKKGNKASEYVLFGLKDGDSRNSTLFEWKNYVLSLCNIDGCFVEGHFTEGTEEQRIKEVQNIIRNITNKYVLGDPVPEDEIESLLRSDSFRFFDSSDGKKSKKKKEKNKKVDNRFTDENGKFRQSKLGDFLIGEYHVKSLDRVLYAFNGVCYESDLNTDILQKRMIELVPDLGRTKRLDVTDYMKLKSPKVERERGTKYICFKNGLLNLETFELVQSSPDVFIRNLIPHDYNPEAFSPRMDKALNEWCNNSDEIRLTLEEAIGYTLTSSTIGQSMFIIQGDKSNGKSSFFFVLQSILGEWNYSSCNMFELGRKFVLASMLDKTANIGDDISNSKISSETVSILKKVSTGNSVETEFKGKDRFKFVPCAKLWYSCNSFPIFNDETGALARRIILIPFLNTFDSTNRERGFEYTFTETDYQYFIRVAIDGLKRVITNNWNITPCSEGERLKEELVTHTDSVRMFLEVTDMKDIVNRSTEDVFDMYRKFCPVSERATVNELSKEIRRKYRLTTQPRTVKDLHGIPRKVRVYIRE